MVTDPVSEGYEDIKKAVKAHNQKVNKAFERAAKGEVIDLTELFISKENVEEMKMKKSRKMRAF